MEVSMKDRAATVSEMFDLSGQTAIVTGGGTGLGQEMARALAEGGANLVLCSRRLERCDDFASELHDQLGVEAVGMRCDVSDRRSIDAVVAATTERFGTIDVLVNNSGTTWAGDTLAMPVEAWRDVMDVNVTGLFSMSQAVGKVMLSQERGSMINVASVTAVQGTRSEVLDAVGYSTSKGAVVTLTRDLAVKWAERGVRVNAVAPGWFPSEMSQESIEAKKAMLLDRIPMRRFGAPSELKGAVAFLASDAASFVTGIVLAVDGGQTAG